MAPHISVGQLAASKSEADTDELVWCSARQTAKAIRAKQVSCEEVVKACLKRIETVNPKLNAVVCLAAEQALAEAREADQALSRGQVKGPLHGVPFTVKDCIDAQGLRCTAGTKGYASRVAERDATAVARLRAAGAVLLGKTNLPEFAMAAESDNLVFGRTNNPFDTARTPGGSSGGEGAIIAAGGSPLGLGSDAGGSIRLPSALSGVAGLKPTLGRVPISGHASMQGITMCMDVAAIGPMARYVEDLALTLPIISGPDAWDPTVVPMPPADPRPVELSKLRVAFYVDNGVIAADTETADTVRAVAKALADAGMKVEENRPEAVSQVVDLFWGILCTDGGQSFRKFLESIGSKEIHPFTERTFEISKQYAPQSVPAIAMLPMRRFGLRAALLQFMQHYDVLLSPVTPKAAPPHGEFQREIHKNISYTCIHNLTGWPAASVPARAFQTGLPVGVQIAALPFREDIVLAVAGQVECALGGYRPPPLISSRS